MRLKGFLLACLMALTLAAKSQVMWILIFGDKLSNDRIQSGINVSLASVNYTGFDESKNLFTWALGGFTDIQLNEHWSLQPEFVFKSPTGANNLNSYFAFDTPPDSLIKDPGIYIEGTSFSLPVFIKYETKYFGLGLGPQLSLAYSTNLYLSGKTLDDATLKLKNRMGEEIYKFDYGISSTLEFYLNPRKKQSSMRLGLKYYYGFGKVFKDKYTAHNSVFMISLGIPVVSKSQLEKQQKAIEE